MLAINRHKKTKQLLLFFAVAVCSYLLLLILKNFLQTKTPDLCSGYEGRASFFYYQNESNFHELNSQCQNEIQEINISVKNKDFLILMKNRKKALDVGYLLPENQEEVPATINFQNQNFPAIIRLKGDDVSHLRPLKSWSLRIKLKKQKHILSMNRFSLQRLQARMNDIDILYQFMMRKQGLIAPRYQFVKVKMNGIDWGLMEMEDHFTREIQEANHHKESIIGKYNETDMWRFKAAYNVMMLYNNPFGSDFEFFSNNTIQNNQKFYKDSIYAKSLMQGWRSQRLSPSQVFDIETYKKFIAITEIWGTYHPMAWNNLRFYYNPYLGKFEPVSFDNSRFSEPLNFSHAEKFPMFNEIIFDPKNIPILETTFTNIIKDVANDQELQKLHQMQMAFIDSFKQYGISPYANINLLQKNRNFIIEKGNDFFTLTDRHWLTQPPTKYLDKAALSLARATAYSDGTVEISNKIPFPITIKKITASLLGITLESISPTNSSIGPAMLYGRSEPYYVHLPSDLQWDKLIIEVESNTNVPFEKIIVNEKILYLDDKHFAGITDHNNLFRQKQSYIKKYDDGSYHLISGTWQVSQPLVFPANAKVVIEAGCHLQLSDNAYIKTEAPLHIQGTEDNPVSLTSIDQSRPWKGIFVVRAKEKSIWQWVNINNTQAYRADPIELTGSVTFYESDIEMNHVNFNHTTAEDMLNIVNSRFKLNNTEFTDSISDAFDADFSYGTISNSLFENISGDGFDTSGSETEISHCIFNNIRDKAISIGEASKARVQQVSISNAGTAIVAKDYSRVMISNSTIKQSTFADMMSYTKKPAYGGALLIANNIQISERPVLFADLDSTLLFNNYRIPNSDLNIKSLYKTGPMQK